MRTSKEVVELIKKWEGLHDGNLKKIGLQPKLCPAGYWTEGYGHVMRDPITGKPLTSCTLSPKVTISTLKEAEELLIKDLIYWEKFVFNKLKVLVNQAQFSALVSHSFNTGGSNTLFSLINSKKNKEAMKFWQEKYTTAKGIKLRGLVSRRAKEAEIFFS